MLTWFVLIAIIIAIVIYARKRINERDEEGDEFYD